MSDSPVAYQAKWIFSVARPPIENGILICRNGKIEDVGERRQFAGIQLVDLGDVAIIPGLVNAHTHLEFSDLNRPLGDPTQGFTKWIESVISHRSGSDQPIDKARSIAKGIAESKAAGVVALGEIATTPWTHECYGNDIAGVVFHEQLGNNPLEASAKTNAIEAKALSLSNDHWQSGISPHAPYSTGLNLFQSLVKLANRMKKPIAMHLAETLEEIQFVETGQGPFAEMLEGLGVPFHRTGPLKISDYLRQLAEVHSLIIHGNFLSIEELELVAEGENQHLVFCPRTHAYFGHQEYPLRTILDLGINVAVGTDSRASNPDLNLFEELKQIAITQSEVSPDEILSMGTINGAKALQLDSQFGTLEPGKSASVCVVDSINSNAAFTGLFAPETTCIPIDWFANNS